MHLDKDFSEKESTQDATESSESTEEQFLQEVVEKIKTDDTIAVVGANPALLARELSLRVEKEFPVPENEKCSNILVIEPSILAAWADEIALKKLKLGKPEITSEFPSKHYNSHDRGIHFATSETVLANLDPPYGYLYKYNVVICTNTSHRSIETEIALGLLSSIDQEDRKRVGLQPLKIILDVDPSELGLLKEKFNINESIEAPHTATKETQIKHEELNGREPQEAIKEILKEIGDQEGDILILLPTGDLIKDFKGHSYTFPNCGDRQPIAVPDYSLRFYDKEAAPNLDYDACGMALFNFNQSSANYRKKRIIYARTDLIYGSGKIPGVTTIIDLGQMQQRSIDNDGKETWKTELAPENVVKWAQSLVPEDGTYIELSDKQAGIRRARCEREIERTTQKAIDELPVAETYDKRYRYSDKDPRATLPLLGKPTPERRPRREIEKELKEGESFAHFLKLAQREGLAGTAGRIIALELIKRSLYFPPPKRPEILDDRDYDRVGRLIRETRMDFKERSKLRGELERYIHEGSRNIQRKYWGEVDKLHPGKICKKYVSKSHPLSDFALQVNLLEEFERLPEERRQKWCEEHRLEYDVFLEALELLRLVQTQFHLDREDTNDDPNAITQALLKTMRRNLVVKKTTDTNRSFLELFSKRKQIDIDQQTLAGGKISLDSPLDLFIAGSLTASQRDKRNLLANKCHPIDIATIMQTFPEFIEQRVVCDFPQNDKFANFRMEVGLVAGQNAALLGTIKDAEITDAQKVTAFANYLASNQVYYDDEISKYQPELSALETWSGVSIQQSAGRHINRRDMIKIYENKLKEIGRQSGSFVYTHERLENLLKEGRLNTQNMKITRHDIENALRRPQRKDPRGSGNRGSRRRR